MPRFDFKCTKCSTTFEATLPFGAKKLPTCAKCGGKTQKLIAPPAIHFKGSGFYVTDKGGTKPAKKEEKNQTANTASKKSATGKKDQPAAKE